jgi:hypothetical protein
MAHWLAPLTKVPCRVYRLVSIADVPPGRGAPPGSVALTGRRPLASDHPVTCHLL